MPTVLELRQGSDRRVLARLEEGDMSAQLATGWRPPEVFVAKGRDGETDIWGVMVQMDGIGTSNRSKAFHDVAWKNLGDAGFPDRILWHRAVAEEGADRCGQALRPVRAAG